MGKTGKQKEPPSAGNLTPWLAEHPEGPNFKHGGFSRAVKGKYQDSSVVLQ